MILAYKFDSLKAMKSSSENFFAYFLENITFSFFLGFAVFSGSIFSINFLSDFFSRKPFFDEKFLFCWLFVDFSFIYLGNAIQTVERSFPRWQLFLLACFFLVATNWIFIYEICQMVGWLVILVWTFGYSFGQLYLSEQNFS